MSEHKPLGVGIVSTGNWARSFWSDAQHSPDVRLVGCWNRTAERAEKFVEMYRGVALPTLEDLINHPEVEAIINFAANSYHREPTELAAAAGKHVFTDKPIANTIEDSVAMIRACEQAGVTLMVGHSSRYAGGPRALKKLLDEGRLGRVAMAEGNASHSGGTRVTQERWRYHWQEAPGGPLMQLSVHTFDTLHYLLGPTRRVTALSNSSLIDSEIEDVFLALLEFDSGVLAYVGTSYVSPGSNFLRLYGMGGNAYVEGGKLTLVTTDKEEFWKTQKEESEVPAASAHLAEMAELARAVRTGTPPETGGKEGLLALAVVWACIESSRGGRPVEVAEVLGEAAALVE